MSDKPVSKPKAPAIQEEEGDGEEDNSPPEVDRCSGTSLPFDAVIIEGDGHARLLAALLQRRVGPTTVVSGVCKPDAKLSSVLAGAPPAPRSCCVLIAGTSDVEAGDASDIYTDLEPQIARRLAAEAEVIVATLPRRHDLPQGHPIHRETDLANTYIMDMCRRLNVGSTRVDSIPRCWFTHRGTLLRMPGKRLLADMLLEGLTRIRSPDGLQRPSPPPAAEGQRARTSPAHLRPAESTMPLPLDCNEDLPELDVPPNSPEFDFELSHVSDSPNKLVIDTDDECVDDDEEELKQTELEDTEGSKGYGNVDEGLMDISVGLEVEVIAENAQMQEECDDIDVIGLSQKGEGESKERTSNFTSVIKQNTIHPSLDNSTSSTITTDDSKPGNGDTMYSPSFTEPSPSSDFGEIIIKTEYPIVDLTEDISPEKDSPGVPVPPVPELNNTEDATLDLPVIELNVSENMPLDIPFSKSNGDPLDLSTGFPEYRSKRPTYSLNHPRSIYGNSVPSTTIPDTPSVAMVQEQKDAFLECSADSRYDRIVFRRPTINDSTGPCLFGPDADQTTRNSEVNSNSFGLNSQQAVVSAYFNRLNDLTEQLRQEVLRVNRTNSICRQMENTAMNTDEFELNSRQPGQSASSNRFGSVTDHHSQEMSRTNRIQAITRPIINAAMNTGEFERNSQQPGPSASSNRFGSVTDHHSPGDSRFNPHTANNASRTYYLKPIPRQSGSDAATSRVSPLAPLFQQPHNAMNPFDIVSDSGVYNAPNNRVVPYSQLPVVVPTTSYSTLPSPAQPTSNESIVLRYQPPNNGSNGYENDLYPIYIAPNHNYNPIYPTAAQQPGNSGARPNRFIPIPISAEWPQGQCLGPSTSSPLTPYYSGYPYVQFNGAAGFVPPPPPQQTATPNVPPQMDPPSLIPGGVLTPLLSPLNENQLLPLSRNTINTSRPAHHPYYIPNYCTPRSVSRSSQPVRGRASAPARERASGSALGRTLRTDLERASGSGTPVRRPILSTYRPLQPRRGAHYDDNVPNGTVPDGAAGHLPSETNQNQMPAAWTYASRFNNYYEPALNMLRELRSTPTAHSVLRVTGTTATATTTTATVTTTTATATTTTATATTTTANATTTTAQHQPRSGHHMAFNTPQTPVEIGTDGTSDSDTTVEE